MQKNAKKKENKTNKKKNPKNEQKHKKRQTKNEKLDTFIWYQELNNFQIDPLDP